MICNSHWYAVQVQVRGTRHVKNSVHFTVYLFNFYFIVQTVFFSTNQRYPFFALSQYVEVPEFGTCELVRAFSVFFLVHELCYYELII